MTTPSSSVAEAHPLQHLAAARSPSWRRRRAGGRSRAELAQAPARRPRRRETGSPPSSPRPRPPRRARARAAAHTRARRSASEPASRASWACVAVVGHLGGKRRAQRLRGLDALSGGPRAARARPGFRARRAEPHGSLPVVPSGGIVATGIEATRDARCGRSRRRHLGADHARRHACRGRSSSTGSSSAAAAAWPAGGRRRRLAGGARPGCAWSGGWSSSAILVIGGALALSRFANFERLAAGILASSAVLTLVIGLAARQVFANPMAGLMLADHPADPHRRLGDDRRRHRPGRRPHPLLHVHRHRRRPADGRPQRARRDERHVQPLDRGPLGARRRPRSGCRRPPTSARARAALARRGHPARGRRRDHRGRRAPRGSRQPRPGGTTKTGEEESALRERAHGALRAAGLLDAEQAA